jgi:hypothetical protein
VVTLFIQVTCGGVEEPIRHTTSCAGAPDEDDGVPVFDVPLELQPAMARAVAAPRAAIAAGVFLSLIAGSPSGLPDDPVLNSRFESDALTRN